MLHVAIKSNFVTTSATIKVMKYALIVIVLLAASAFGWWTLSPLFIDKEVQDEIDPILQARIEAQKKVDAEREARQKALADEIENIPDESTPEPVTDEPIDDFGVTTSGPFPITGTTGHPASGNIEIIESPEEKLVYYKNYYGTNGPDLKVYLAKDLDARDIVDLGDAKGNQGNLIYGAPPDVDFSEYKYVLTWCEAFGVLFDYAKIN